jgi:type I restriction enzyme S subunit
MYAIKQIGEIAVFLDPCRSVGNGYSFDFCQGPYVYYGKDSAIKRVDDYNIEGTWLICGKSVQAISNRNTLNITVVEEKAFVNEGFYVFRCQNDLETRFLARVLRNTSVKGLIKGMFTPGCHLDIELLKKITITMPDTKTMETVEDAYRAIERSQLLLEEQDALLFISLDALYQEVFGSCVDGMRKNEAMLGELALVLPGKDLSGNQRKRGNIPLLSSFGISGTHDTALSAGETIVLVRSGNRWRLEWSPVSCWPLGRCSFIDSKGADVPLPWLFFAFRRVLADVFAKKIPSPSTISELMSFKACTGTASQRSRFAQAAHTMLQKHESNTVKRELFAAIMEEYLDAFVIETISQRQNTRTDS